MFLFINKNYILWDYSYLNEPDIWIYAVQIKILKWGMVYMLRI
jgi:hypothetical protein